MRTAKRVALAALVLVSMLAVTTAAEAKAPKRFYLLLGDSLSVGVQPTKSGKSVNTRQGYPRQLAKLVGNLKLVEYGLREGHDKDVHRRQPEVRARAQSGL